MSMFDKFKEINEARKMQSELKKQVVTLEERGVKLVMNGTMQLEELKLNPDVSIPEQESIVKDLHGKALRKLQEALMKQYMNK